MSPIRPYSNITLIKEQAPPHSITSYGEEEAIRRCEAGIDKWAYEMTRMIEWRNPSDPDFRGKWEVDLYGNRFVAEDDPRNTEYKDIQAILHIHDNPHSPTIKEEHK